MSLYSAHVKKCGKEAETESDEVIKSEKENVEIEEPAKEEVLPEKE